MMYSNKVAACLKVGGKVLREDGDIVYLPFGSEYSVFIRNLNSVRALVTVEIDGQDIADGRQFVVSANDSIDIERFLKNTITDVGQRFKFIERTTKIENGPRGIKAEDGLIRIQVEFELPIQQIFYKSAWHGLVGGQSGQINNSLARGFTSDSCVSQASYSGAPGQTLNDVGITVGGSLSSQKFQEAESFPTDGQKHVMVLRLLGEADKKPIQTPVTVKTKLECPTCGTKSKVGSKFCPECGTGLSIV